MGTRDEIVELPSMQVDNRWFEVALQIWHDGTRYGGRLWFTAVGAEADPIPGRRLFIGNTREELIGRVHELTADDTRAQFRHAMIDRRRYLPLRATTEEILHNIRQINNTAIALRNGTMSDQIAAYEMDLYEEKLHDLVSKLREVAGIEELPE